MDKRTQPPRFPTVSSLARTLIERPSWDTSSVELADEDLGEDVLPTAFPSVVNGRVVSKRLKPCAWCDEPASNRYRPAATGVSIIYCSAECAALIALHASGKLHTDLTWTQCPECGQWINHTRYCSRRCTARITSRSYHARKRAAQQAPGAQVITLWTLAERDVWRCHICTKRVTRKTWSADHLIPLSLGGPHTWANVALAHRRCNSSRGAGRLPAQLRLEIDV